MFKSIVIVVFACLLAVVMGQVHMIPPRLPCTGLCMPYKNCVLRRHRRAGCRPKKVQACDCTTTYPELNKYKY